MNNIIDFWKKIFGEIGVKKFWLSFHYGLAIITSLSVFVLCVICTLIPQTIDVGVLTNIYKIIMIYCGVVIAYITILSIFDKMQTMNKKNTKFDFIAFYVGTCLFITLGIIIACIIFMFKHECNETHKAMWIFLIGVFGAMFITQSSGGFINNIFKRKYGSLENEEKEQEDNIQENDIKMELYNNADNQNDPPSL